MADIPAMTWIAITKGDMEEAMVQYQKERYMDPALSPESQMRFCDFARREGAALWDLIVSRTNVVELEIRDGDSRPVPGDHDFKPVTHDETAFALIESVKLQSHYAALLNQYDSGRRMIFPSSGAWIDRLRKIGKLAFLDR